jgi:hypothetical protein
MGEGNSFAHENPTMPGIIFAACGVALFSLVRRCAEVDTGCDPRMGLLETAMKRHVIFCGVIWCGAMTLSAAAQQSMGTQQMSIGSNQSLTSVMLQPVTEAPYQAEKVARSVQTLSDGTVITHETRGLIARDAQGRMREDLYQVHSGNVNGRETDLALQSATVGDPVAHTMLIWTGEKTKIAMKMELPTMPKSAMSAMLAAPPPPPPPGGVRSTVRPIFDTTLPPGNAGATVSMPSSPPIGGVRTGTKDQVHTEELGQQSIEGVLVTGKRVTTTIPIGEVGNDRPIVVVHEEWRSPELKIVVKTIDTDPRTGEQTMELQGLSRADPDPALFQAPAGYQVKDMAEMLKGIGDLGNAKTQ